MRDQEGAKESIAGLAQGIGRGAGVLEGRTIAKQWIRRSVFEEWIEGLERNRHLPRAGVVSEMWCADVTCADPGCALVLRIKGFRFVNGWRERGPLAARPSARGGYPDMTGAALRRRIPERPAAQVRRRNVVGRKPLRGRRP